MDRLIAYRCARCTRLTLRWDTEPPPAGCAWPTCRHAGLTTYPLHRAPEENR